MCNGIVVLMSSKGLRVIVFERSSQWAKVQVDSSGCAFLLLSLDSYQSNHKSCLTQCPVNSHNRASGSEVSRNGICAASFQRHGGSHGDVLVLPRSCQRRRPANNRVVHPQRLPRRQALRALPVQHRGPRPAALGVAEGSGGFPFQAKPT